MGYQKVLDPSVLEGRGDRPVHLANLGARAGPSMGVDGDRGCDTGVMPIDAVAERPADLRSRVESVIEVIRPAIQADEGDIVLVEVDVATGEVVVELVGACVACPASDQTLKAGIERILMDRVPGVTGVRNIGETLDADGTAVSF